MKNHTDSTASILFGKTRRAVLALLFEQPARRFFLRELARLTGISPGSLQRELGRLGQADLVERAKDGNRVTYWANAAHPVFGDLQALVHKTCGIPSQLKEALAPFYRAGEGGPVRRSLGEGGIVFAVVYGSIAKGADHARSDVDLLIVGSLGMDQVTAALTPIEKRIDREIGLRLYSLADFQSRRAQGDAFLNRVMAGPLTPILGDPESA